jgi:hypothetical protein
VTPSVSAPTLRALAVARAGTVLGRIGPVHCEDAVTDANLSHALERQAIAARGETVPPIRAALLASIEHGVHEHPFLLLAARADPAAPWSVLEMAGLARRPRAGVRFVIANVAAVAVGHFAPDARAVRVWLRLADATGDVRERVDDAVLVLAAVGDPAAASPARLEYLAADGSTISSEEIRIEP